jgi:hypothetical protein
MRCYLMMRLRYIYWLVLYCSSEPEHNPGLSLRVQPTKFTVYTYALMLCHPWNMIWSTECHHQFNRERFNQLCSIHRLENLAMYTF